MPESPERTALYRLYDAVDRLLYVGITNDPRERFKAHAADKSWWGKVATREIEWFNSRAEAEMAEIEAVRSEQPLCNVVRFRAMHLHPMARLYFGDQPFTRHDLVKRLRLPHGTLSVYIPRLTATGAFRKVGTELGTQRALFVAVEAPTEADASPVKGPLAAPASSSGAIDAREACPVTFGTALRRYRAAQGMSLAEVARLVHFHRGFIHRVETGERCPNQLLAEAADIALRANGALVEAFAADEAIRQEEAATDLREAIATLGA